MSISWKITIEGSGPYTSEDGASLPALGAALVDELKQKVDIHAATFTHGSQGHDILDAEAFVASEKSKADAQAVELAKIQDLAAQRAAIAAVSDVAIEGDKAVVMVPVVEPVAETDTKPET